MSVCSFLKFKHFFGVNLFVLFFVSMTYGQSAKNVLYSTAEMLPETPVSPFLEELEDGYDLDFCAQWNPEFAFRGNHCCSSKVIKPKKRRGHRCDPKRLKSSYCDEITTEQRKYIEDVKSGKITDVLAAIKNDLLVKKRTQSFCTVNNGFLAYGRPVVGTAKNRIQLRSPARCVNTGTDGMVGMVEWLGQQVAQKYSDSEHKGVQLVVGDLSAPRGGCLVGRGGRRGHASHMAGLDVDIAFLQVRKNAQSPINFEKNFDGPINWWLTKQIFRNPFVCVKVIFLDRRLISKLAKAAAGDPEWVTIKSHLRHVKGHRNHFHVRVGTSFGVPGCNQVLPDDKELLDEIDETDSMQDES